MSTFYYPSFPANNIVDSVGTFTNTGALNFTGISRANVSINANVTLTVTGVNAGETKKIRFYNSRATNLVTITNPTASNWILQRGLTTVSLLAGEYVMATVYYDGTNYELIYGEAMVKNA